MGSQYTCDYCGEPIETQRDTAHVHAIGWDQLGDYHATTCLDVIREAISDACGRSVGRPRTAEQRRCAEREQQRAARDAQREGWTKLPPPARERVVIETLADASMTVTEISEKLQEREDMRLVYYSAVYPTVKALLAAGELQRAHVLRRGHTVYAYSRKTGMSGPIVDLERTFNATDEAA